MTGPQRLLHGLDGHRGSEAAGSFAPAMTGRCGCGWGRVGEGSEASGVERTLSVGTPTLEGSIRTGGSFPNFLFPLFSLFWGFLVLPCFSYLVALSLSRARSVSDSLPPSLSILPSVSLSGTYT